MDSSSAKRKISKTRSYKEIVDEVSTESSSEYTLQEDNQATDPVTDRTPLASTESGHNGTFSVSEAISSMGFGKAQWRLLFMCGALWAADALEIMLLAFLLPAVSKQWNLEPFWDAMVGGIVFAGMLFGAPSWGIISDQWGRKIGFVCSVVLTGCVGLLSSFAPSLPWLLVMRCLVGFGLAGSPVAFSLFAEFLPLSSRGISLTALQAFWTFGAVFEAALAWVIMPTLGWRWLVGISSIPLLAVLAFYPVLPESPRFLLEKGKTEKAMEELQKVSYLNSKELPPGELIHTPTTEIPAKQLFLELWKPSMRKTSALLWIIWFANSFAYYGLVILTPAYFEVKADAEDSADPEFTTFMNTLVTSAAEFPGLLLAAYLVDKVGRKKTQALFFGLCGIFSQLLILDAPFQILTVIAVIARFCIAAAFSTTYICTPEVYPTYIRTTGLGTASAFSRIAGILTPMLAAYFSDSQIYIPLIIYGVTCVVAAISSMLLPMETSKQEMK